MSAGGKLEATFHFYVQTSTPLSLPHNNLQTPGVALILIFLAGLGAPTGDL